MSQHGMDEQAKYEYQAADDQAAGRVMSAATAVPAPPTDLQSLYSQLQKEIDVLDKTTGQLRNQCDQAYGEEVETGVESNVVGPAVVCGGSIGALYELMTVLTRCNELLHEQVSRLNRL